MAVADLYLNRPEGVCRLTGVHYTEGGALDLSWRILVGGQPVDLSTCTIDLAQITDGIDGAVISTPTVTLGADGVVTIDGSLAGAGEALTARRSHPNGKDVVLTVRLLDGAVPFYLVAPSTITIRHSPGSAT